MAANRPRRTGLKAYAAISLIIWIVVTAPVSVLLFWLMDLPTGTALLVALALAPLAALWMWRSVQTANPRKRWPAMQLLGWTGILMSVVIFTSPLLWMLPRPSLGLVALSLWLVLGAWGLHSALTIRHTKLHLSDNRLDRAYRFVHLSDVHAGSRDSKFIEKVVGHVIGHQPDGVFITGDLIDSSAVDRQFLSALSALNCPAWLCIGNHERYVDLPAAIAAIEANGVIVLRNTSVEYGPFQIIGIDDADNPKQVSTQMTGISLARDKYSVLLYHRPDGWPAARDAGVDLTLAGHTHAGQIWPFGLLVQRQFPRMAGIFTEAGKTLFVSRGTGTWGPTMRLGTFSEMTVITLSPAQA